MIFKSLVPDIVIPDTPLTPYVLQRAKRLADKPALIDGPSGRTLTYGQLAGAIHKTAAGLAQRGFKKGDVFAIYSPNLPEYAIVFHAVAILGGISTTVNPLYTADELAQQLSDSGARFLVTVEPFLKTAREAAAKSRVEEVFVFGQAPEATPFAALMQNDGEVPTVQINPAEDLVVLPYSSGTTGLPKGVMLTHRNLVANIVQLEHAKDFTPFPESDVLVGVIPFFHIYGMVVIMNYGLARGATTVTMPRFDMEQFLGILQKYRVTFAHLVPPIVLGLAKHPLVSQFDLSALRTINSGAAPLGENVAQEAAQRLGTLVIQGYGLTETSPVTHVNPDKPEMLRLASVGNAMPNTEVKIMDVVSGDELGPNQDGEIWVRGPQVMKGYLNRPEDTAAAIDAEGWFRTGDIGHMDTDGYLYVVDRLKELIKYKGMQVAPAELEAVLLSHPAVLDCAVIPSPDEEAGEIPKAFVVLRDQATPQEIMDFVGGKVAPHKRIRQLEVIEQIPKTASGKILRRVLTQREREAKH